MIYATFLAGGSGTRLWPLSRENLPKHLLSLTGKETLLQQTARRLLGKVPPERIVTITHEDHHSAVRGQLHAVNPALAEHILAEPVANNTLPAIAWGVMTIAKNDPEALIGVFPADHLIQGEITADEETFHETLTQAFEVAREDCLVTLGIKPTTPETGYGYIQSGRPILGGKGLQVASFTEKPDRASAEKYLKAGNYFWNSGMFAFRASIFLEELKKLEPGIFAAVMRIVESGSKQDVVWEEYSRMKSISIDYGIMEKSKRVAVVPATFGWSDLGSWESVYQIREKDERQNVVEGEVIAEDTSSSLLISKKGTLATIGLKEMVVIQTGDAVLVSSRDRVQDVKKIVEQLKAKESPLAETHQTAHRPWGSYTVLEEGPGYKIKRIVVNSGQKLSLQRHQKRSEHWVVIEGTAKVTYDDKEMLLQPNQSTFIPKGENHRLENPGTTPLTIIEVQTGTYLGEDDIERFDDVYGRVHLPR